MQVDYDNYKEQNFVCPECGWQGKGDKLAIGDFSETHVIQDLECPKCFHLIAYWQGPLIEKNNEETNINS